VGLGVGWFMPARMCMGVFSCVCRDIQMQGLVHVRVSVCVCVFACVEEVWDRKGY